MHVVINGQEQMIHAGHTVAALLDDLKTPAERVAVEVNEELVSRKLFADILLNDGDRVEIVTFVGGG